MQHKHGLVFYEDFYKITKKQERYKNYILNENRIESIKISFIVKSILALSSCMQSYENNRR